MLDELNHYFASRYAAWELEGSLMIGRWARRTKDDYLRGQLTWHATEESRHSLMWAKLILSNKQQPLKIPPANRYFHAFQSIDNDIDMLAFIHIYELGVPGHFKAHAAFPGVPEDMKALLLQLVEEEGPHLSWIHEWLDKQKSTGKETEVEQALEKYRQLEKATEQDYLSELAKREGQWGEFGKFLAKELKIAATV
jgi:rubrerythrin